MEAIQKACKTVDASFNFIPFQKLDFGEVTAVEQFHGADVAVIDISVQEQQNSLLYLLGVRESFGMKQNILIYSECSAKRGLQLRLSCSNYAVISYKVNDNNECVTVEACGNKLQDEETNCEGKMLLSQKLVKILQEIQVQQK